MKCSVGSDFACPMAAVWRRGLAGTEPSVTGAATRSVATRHRACSTQHTRGAPMNVTRVRVDISARGMWEVALSARRKADVRDLGGGEPCGISMRDGPTTKRADRLRRVSPRSTPRADQWRRGAQACAAGGQRACHPTVGGTLAWDDRAKAAPALSDPALARSNSRAWSRSTPYSARALRESAPWCRSRL